MLRMGPYSARQVPNLHYTVLKLGALAVPRIDFWPDQTTGMALAAQAVAQRAAAPKTPVPAATELDDDELSCTCTCRHFLTASGLAVRAAR